jgi:hypothetical protein
MIIVASMGNLDMSKVAEMRLLVLNNIVNNGTDHTCRIHKEFTNVLQNEIYINLVPDAPMKGSLSEEALEYGNAIIDCSKSFHWKPDSIPNTDELWFVSTLSQTRVFPNPERKTLHAKLAEYINSMATERKVTTPEKNRGAYDLGRIVAYEGYKRRKKTLKGRPWQTHLSLTSGSCMEASRAKLGKWHLALPESELNQFLETPVILHEFKLGRDREGEKYLDDYGNVICRAEDSHLELWRVAYMTGPLEGTRGDHIKQFGLLGESLQIGFDARYGRLVHLWTLSKLREFEVEDRLLKGKLVTVAEPGSKIRPLTSGEAWAYLYMVPAMHLIKEALEDLPGARVGLSDTSQLWRYGQSYKKHYDRVADENLPEAISSSDLTSATDFADQEINKQMLNGFIDETWDDKPLKRYLRSACGLACAGKEIEFNLMPAEWRQIKNLITIKTKTISGKGHKSFTSKRGLMMGDPIVKNALTMASMGAYYATTAGFPNVESCNYDKYVTMRDSRKNILGFRRSMRPFACAGDDHVMVGSVEEVMRPPRFLESMGFVISWDKYRISRRYVHYCQDFGIHPRYRREIHFDTVRMRLFNEFRKGNSRDNFEEPNPLIGKAKELEKIVACLDPERKSFMEAISPILLRVGMPSWFTADVFKTDQIYLPTRLGGLGIPSVLQWESNELCMKYAKSSLARRYFRSFVEPRAFERTREWERGVEFTVVKSMLQLQMKEMNRVEAFTEVKSLLETEEFSAPMSNRRVYRQMMKDVVNVEEPISALGTKEIPYGLLYTGEYTPKATRTRYIRKEISKMMKWANNVSNYISVLVLELDVHYNGPYPVGRYVSREELIAELGAGFMALDLSVETTFFKGSEGRYCRPSYDEEKIRLEWVSRSVTCDDVLEEEERQEERSQ